MRAWTVARLRAMNAALADDEATPLAIIGGTVLWLLRLVLAPMSTLAGFRGWVLEDCPVAPGRRARSRLLAGPPARPGSGNLTRPSASSGRPGLGPFFGSKTAKFLALVIDRYGPLENFPISHVSRVCAELAPEVDLDPGSARTALRRRVLAAQPQESTS